MTSLKQDYDALILGAGAAGLMCAVEAGRRGRRVAVLELAERPGKKILISGGGRCNFTNIHCTPENFISSNPHFAKSALARYTPADFIALVEKHHIPYHEKTLGQLFCDRSAQDILGMLEKECAAAGVHLFTRTTVKEVLRSDQFVARADNKEFRTPVLVAADGGLAIPKVGATDFGYRLARQFGLRVCKTRPGASHLQRRRSPSVRGFGGSLHRCHRCVQRPAFPGEDAHHPSGTQRAGDPADLVVLEKRATYSRGPCPRRRGYSVAAATSVSSNPCGSASGVADISP